MTDIFLSALRGEILTKTPRTREETAEHTALPDHLLSCFLSCAVDLITTKRGIYSIYSISSPEKNYSTGRLRMAKIFQSAEVDRFGPSTVGRHCQIPTYQMSLFSRAAFGESGTKCNLVGYCSMSDYHFSLCDNKVPPAYLILSLLERPKEDTLLFYSV